MVLRQHARGTTPTLLALSLAFGCAQSHVDEGWPTYEEFAECGEPGELVMERDPAGCVSVTLDATPTAWCENDELPEPVHGPSILLRNPDRLPWHLRVDHEEARVDFYRVDSGPPGEDFYLVGGPTSACGACRSRGFASGSGTVLLSLPELEQVRYVFGDTGRPYEISLCPD